MIVSFGCAEKFIQLIKIMKFPVISTMSQRASKSVGAERGHLRWKEPTSVAFSNIVNEILLRQDWYEIVVLYDGMYCKPNYDAFPSWQSSFVFYVNFHCLLETSKLRSMLCRNSFTVS